MFKCPYNNTCIKTQCDLSCGEFSELEHWCNRCGISINNPAINASVDDIYIADRVLKNSKLDNVSSNSNYMHISLYCCNNVKYMADLISYTAICRYCKNIGFYNGVYKLNFSQYLDEVKQSWTSRGESELLENMRVWMKSAKYLIIYNLGLVRFGDFESQTLLTLFQERYDEDKFTVIVLETGKFCLNGKSDSLFFHKLKDEFKIRGARL